MTTAIETSGLCVRAGAKSLVDHVSLSVARGETVALVGPNGAGKSTLLRALGGEITPASGIVTLKGRNLNTWSSRDLAFNRFVLSQNVSVAFPFLVHEIVRMGAGEQGGAAVDTLVELALAEVDLEDFHDRIIGTLSGGEQQRVHFARVMVQLACGEKRYGPGILLLDEPTASLDLCHQLDIVAAVQSRARNGTTVIAILHDLNLATLLANRVAVLAAGRIMADGPPVETVNDRILREIFGVVSAACRIPDNAAPFVLPHAARKYDHSAIGPLTFD
ncbi:MAG TPA: heme ABC transporter ATP-binding protein [Pseudolabrys sp.]|nr:heme ABC transporter ATP-binding protein [Pseudolabrys sp.]